MPRVARTVIPGLPHLLTQRGSRQSLVFYSDIDRVRYLHLLAHYADLYKVRVLAYCVMPDHVHFIVIPAAPDSLALLMRTLNMRYAQEFNRRHGGSGHLWQNRYFSTILSEEFLPDAIRYVENNAVRAKLVERAEHYRWSSAAGHAGLRHDTFVSRQPLSINSLPQPENWAPWLAMGSNTHVEEMLRRHARSGFACGSPEFISQLEMQTGRQLSFRKRGRPRKSLPLS